MRVSHGHLKRTGANAEDLRDENQNMHSHYTIIEQSVNNEDHNL